MINSRNFRHFLMCTCAAAGTFAGGAAHAQSAGPTAAPSDAGSHLEEIVVTAERRSESLQKAPVAVTAISADTLKALNVTTAADLTQVVPNLVVGANGSSAQIGMRGAISTTPGPFADQAVGFSVDGVYIARGGSALTSLYDVAQVEVLRGPQGTLYGRNTIAGLINVITAKPSLEGIKGAASVGYGNYNDLETSGMINLPVSSTFAIRGAFMTDRHDGYSHNAPGRDYNDLDSTAGRIEALWKPSDAFNALVSASYYHNGGVGGGGISGGAPLGLYATSAGATPYRYQEPAGSAFTNETTKDVTATLNYEMPWATATYVGSYRSDHYQGSGLLAVQGPIVETLPSGICATADDPTCFTLAVKNNGWQTSHEVRLGHTSEAFKWVVGAYYFKYQDKNITAISPCPCGQPFDIYDPGSNKETSHAVFGQATWSPIRRLRLTGGVRYNNEYKFTTNLLYIGGPGTVQGFECPDCAVAGTPTGGSTRIHKVTWKAGADMDITPTTMAFFSAANGFKNGGINDDGSTYKPEVIMNYELGLKTRLFDNHVQVNIDGFHELYTDYQATAGQLVGNTVSLETINAGKATINGVELESLFQITPDDRIGLNGTYLHARFTSFPLPHGDGFNGGAPEDLSGKTVPYTPSVTLRADYQHTFHLASGATVVPRIDTSYVASQEIDYHNYSAGHVPHYTRTGLSLTYNAPKIDGRVGWSVQAWVKNIENHAVLITGQIDNTLPVSLVGQAGKDGFYLAPRTYGLKVSANF